MQILTFRLKVFNTFKGNQDTRMMPSVATIRHLGVAPLKQLQLSLHTTMRIHTVP